ncbi:zinc finger protein 91-like [Clupea harengus]|uniref:Zinc finger protein 865 n=1 Tax=Clupea harengus TaxID=7950 RepID=A0A6P8GLM5_CLUHA|nr:zinc finger protein 91-like [Clupea harengus]XP_031438496.1 zinc finger protein 91-like [Clupea harengus]XP_031438497.1 zinc finger protein 91-like [Clupea harengus]
MQPQSIAKEEPGPHVSVLRLLTPPLRLLCATIWQVVQERDVFNYGMLEEFVTLTTETVPELLSHRQRAQLILGLRAKVVLELCRSESSTDTETIQHHLDRIRIPAAHLAEFSMSDADVETSESNFLALVDILLNDPIERDIFFQEVFPVEYGPKYDHALQRLIWIFVSRLEEVLPVPSITKVASMLRVAPSVTEECFQALSHPQELLNSLHHHKNHPDTETKASSPAQPSPDDDCIFSCLSHPPLVRVVMDTERKASEIEFESSYCEEVSVESEGVSASATEVHIEYVKSEEEMSTNSEERSSRKEKVVETAHEEGMSTNGEERRSRKEEVVEIAHSQRDDVHEDGEHHGERVCEEVQVDSPQKTATPDEEEPLNSDEATSCQAVKFIKEDGMVADAYEVTIEDRPERREKTEDWEGQTVSAHETRGDPRNDVCLQRHPTVKLERIDITGKPLPPPLPRQSGRVRRKRVRLLWRKNRGPEITWVDSEDELDPTPKNVHSVRIPKTAKSDWDETPASMAFACSKCSFHDGTEASLHQHLMKNHPEEFSRLLSAGIRQTSGAEPLGNRTAGASVHEKELPKRGSVSKTCPVCTKTFTRGSDMRRHLKGHSGERLHCCPGCGRCFQHLHDLKRHAAGCRELAVPQPKQDPPSGEGNEPESNSQHEERTEVLDTTDSSKEVPQDSKEVPQVVEVPTSSIEQPDSVTPDPRLCPVCGLVLARSSDMERHMRSHSVEKPYECLHCSKTYRYPYNLKKHVDTRHKGLGSPENESAENPNDGSNDQTAVKVGPDLTLSPGDVHSKVCPTCGKTFTRATDMRRHQKCHSGHRFECSQCGKGFRYPFDLKQHKQNSCTEPSTQPQGVISAKRPLVCGTCGKKFSFLTHFERHMRAHRQANKPTKRWHKCAKCEEIFRTLYDLGKHQRCHWGDDPLRCTQCGRRFSHSNQLASHKQVHMLVFTMKCTMCEEIFTDLATFRLHYLQVHNIKGAYPCSHCEKSFTELCPLIRHLRTHTGERPYQCPQCPKSFSTPSKLSMHKRAHGVVGEKAAPRERRHLCHECGKCFYTSAELLRHEVVHREERPHTCTHCGKAFKRMRSLTAHTESHMESHVRMRFPCSYCGKTFIKAGALVRHHRIHTGERPHRCSECNKSFLTRSEVLKHMRFHTGERPFKCEVCSKSFTQSCYLTAHMRTHTGERPYACKVCDKRFSDSAHRKRHMLIHTGEKPHVCERCGRAFNRKNLLNVHLKTCTID